MVTIGGGTGSFMLLSGLKKYPIELSAIVAMTDDGGASGVLRDELGVLPPGDVRQCLVALSDASLDLRTLMNYRFSEGGLKGHSFGNLFLSALEKTHKNFLEGVETAMEILKVRGKVIPVTGSKAHLRMELQDGTFLDGEDVIDHALFQNQGFKKLSFQKRVKVNPRAVDALRAADIIVIGPGDLYGSILANLIIPEIQTALQKSRAKVIYNANLTNKKGHTSGFCVDDYVDAIENAIGKNRIDAVMFNVKKPSQKLIDKYAKQEGAGFWVELDEPKNQKKTYQIIKGDFLKSGEAPRVKGDALGASRAFIRHDGDKLARAIMSQKSPKVHTPIPAP